MATIGDDKRRQDDNRTLWNPYWLTSLEFDYADVVGGLAALLWSFPAAKYGTRKIIIENIAIQVLEVFAGGTESLDVGAYTLATDAVTTGGTATLVDADEYIPSADITETSTGIYWAATGDWITSKLLMTNAAPVVISPADATVPCVCVTGNASLSGGRARVLMQVTEVPFF